MTEKKTPVVPSTSAGGRPARKPRTRLAPSQKYEVFTAVLTSSATQRELAERYRIDRSTIQAICRTARQGLRNDQILWMVSGVVGVRNAPSRG